MNWYKKAQVDEDIAADYYDQYYETIHSVLQDFTESPLDARQQWTLVPFARVKKIWSDYMKTGIVSDVKGMESISKQMIENTHKLAVNTYLMGHTQGSPQEHFDDYGMDENEQERFYYYAVEEDGTSLISDYGLDPLMTLALELSATFSAEEQLQIVDRMFNVIHMRSDLPGLFIEGGTSSLIQLSERPSDSEQELAY